MKPDNTIIPYKRENVLLYVEYVMLFLIFSLMFNITAYASNSNKRITIKIQKTIPLDEQLMRPNCIYEIYDGFNLCNSTLTVPDSVTLRFKGGYLSNGVIIGNRTTIESPLLCILKDVSLQGTWQNEYCYPEWFGAVGDGKTDDTNAIRKAIWFAVGMKLVFQRKTYIVNVTPGNEVNKQRIIFPNCKCSEIIGNKSIIKLGDNDNCNLYNKKGFVAMFSVYTIDSFHVKGITFDYNYNNNPIYQTQGQSQLIQENTQLNTFQFRRVNKVFIEKCSFIGHSGTNCIDYNDANYNVGDKTFEVTINNCNFIKSGGKSFFLKGNNILDAYHDCSTIAIHYCGTYHKTPYIVNIKNNYFEGIGGNAFNVIETDASLLNFSGNTIRRFSSCVFLCAGIYDGNIEIVNNNLYDISRGVVLWMRSGNYDDSDQYAYNSVNIDRNVCNLNVAYWDSIPRYDNVISKEPKIYGFVLTTAENNKSARNLTIRGNIIRYKYLSGEFQNISPKATFSFENAAKSIKMMRCGRLDITKNIIYNAIHDIIHNALFQEIDTLFFCDNHIYNPFFLIEPSLEKGGGIIYLYSDKRYTPSLSRPMINNFIALNNDVYYRGYEPNDGCAFITNSKIMGGEDVKNNVLIVKGNRCSSMPQYGPVHFSEVGSLFGKVLVEKNINSR